MASLGVDIGGTNARVALVEATGEILEVAKRPLADHSPGSVVQAIAELFKSLGSPKVPHVGVGVAGMVRGPLVVNAPNLGWRAVDFGTMLSTALGLPVRLVNDLSAAAWGERSGGVAKGCSDTFTVFVGTGVGSAIISRGALLSGATGVAAEFGHLKLTLEGGRPCGCGMRGCLEAYVGGARLTAWMREEGLQGTPADLERAALGGEPKARELYDFASGSLALAIANQVTVLNPAMVVLGGGVLNHCPGMVARIRQVVGDRANPPAREGLRIELAALGDDSGLVGAALLGL